MRHLRRLLVLVERQFVDDGPYYVGIMGIVVAFLLLLGLLSLIYPHAFLLPVGLILLGLPVLLCTVLFAFGAVTVHGDRNQGTLTFLSVRSLPAEIVFARLVAGVTFTLLAVVISALAVVGAVVSGLVPWPESLFPGGLIDLFVGLFEIGLASYCLALMTGRKTETLTAALRPWPLALILVSLVIAKGFAQPLNITLVAFIVFSTAYLLLCSSHRRPAMVAKGLVVLVLTVIPLYWLRYASDVLTALAMIGISDEATINFYYEFRPEVHSYPGIGPFTVRSEISSGDFPVHGWRVHSLLQPLGIMSYLRAREPGGDHVDLHHFGHYYGFYYDGRRGLFVRRNSRGTLYAGPQGVAESLGEDVGVFGSPIVCTRYYSRTVVNSAVVFDRAERCFYTIDFNQQDVRRGPDFTDRSFQPVDAMTSRLGGGFLRVRCYYPLLRGSDEPYAADGARAFLPVVGESAAIAVLDLRRGELIDGAGHLPRPFTLSGRGSCRPRDCFDYDVRVILKQPEGGYAGLVAVTASRQGAPVTLAVFDKNARLMREAVSRKSRMALVMPLVAKSLIEGLHPPVLTLISFFAAYGVDAGATHRALFLMPNSLVALQRDRQTNLFFQFLWASLFLVPALLFAGFLSWRAAADAAVAGLAQRTRRAWLFGVLAFGLPAYVTYRLTHRKATLVTCRNCGRARRPDRDRCHHCGSGWDMPEQDPRGWRVSSEARRPPNR